MVMMCIPNTINPYALGTGCVARLSWCYVYAFINMYRSEMIDRLESGDEKDPSPDILFLDNHSNQHTTLINLIYFKDRSCAVFISQNHLHLRYTCSCIILGAD